MSVNGEAIVRMRNQATALRAVVRGPIVWVAAGWLMTGAAGAQAQELPSKPLNWPASLPAAVSSSLPLPSDEDGLTSFLKGRFLVGVNLTHGLTPEDYVGSRWSVSPFFRNTPRRVGWGPSFGLNWFTGDIDVVVDGVRSTIGEVKVRPIMVGVGYTVNSGREGYGRAAGRHDGGYQHHRLMGGAPEYRGDVRDDTAARAGRLDRLHLHEPDDHGERDAARPHSGERQRRLPRRLRERDRGDGGVDLLTQPLPRPV
jgi:hypothetical protein